MESGSDKYIILYDKNDTELYRTAQPITTDYVRFDAFGGWEEIYQADWSIGLYASVNSAVCQIKCTNINYYKEYLTIRFMYDGRYNDFGLMEFGNYYFSQ